ncbi:hypothetical protein JTB14_017848 [Gonioctena quinquepunctata]|nr:hypothetical protein JTB14_017848 [Gonioctena quinquepunctata]
MYGITQIVFCSLVVCVIRVSTERDDSDLNLSQVFRTPKDFSRVNFDHLEILERNNFDQPQPSHQPEPENNGEPQLTHHPKSVANAQVMLRFGGDDIRGKNVIECPEKCGRSPTRINPNHNHHIMNNEMRYPNYPPYSQPQFLPPVPPPSPYNYAYSAPPPPYYFPGPYYPSRMPTYELPNGQLVPANGPNFSEERPISVDNFLEYRKKEENLANINRPKIILTEEMSNDTIPEVNCTDWRRNPSKKDQNDEYTETSDGNYIKVPSAGRYISLSTNPKEFPILTSPVFPESENKPEKSSVLQPNVEGLKGYILPQSLQKEYVFLPQPGKESGIWLTPTRKEYQVGTEKEKPFNSPQDVEEIRRNISPPSSSEKVYASRPQSEKESVIWMIPTREEINNHQVHAQQEISCGFPQDMKNVKGNISPLLPKEIGSYQVPAEQETSCDFAQDKKDMNGNISPPLPEKADVSLPPTNPKAFSILMSPGSPVCGNEVRTEPAKNFRYLTKR